MTLNVVIPMAGMGKRFVDYGFTINKYLLPIDQHLTPMIEKAITTLNIKSNIGAQFIFIIREDNDNIDVDLRQLLINICNQNNYKCIISSVNKLTEGPAATVNVVKDYINNDDPLIVSNSDQILDYDFDKFYEKCCEHDGCVMTYKLGYKINIGDKDKHSFIRLDENGRGIQVEEKIAISNNPLVGTHYYKKGRYFLDSYNYIVEHNIRAPNGEFYISNTYQAMINLGYKIGIHELDNTCEYFYPVGEPIDYLQYYNKTCSLTKYDLNTYKFVNDDIKIRFLKKYESLTINNSLVKIYSGQINIPYNVFTTGDNLKITSTMDSVLFIVKNISDKFAEIDITKYTRGWILGKFEPALKQTSYEVGFLTHTKGQYWGYHYHKQSDEINILRKGKMVINDIEINENDVFVFERNIISCPIFLEDCDIICIKSVSDRHDKYII